MKIEVRLLEKALDDALRLIELQRQQAQHPLYIAVGGRIMPLTDYLAAQKP